MHIVLVGLNHKAAPVEVRERIAFSSSQLPAALAEASRYVGEAVILSTCNRTELYTLAARPEEGAAGLCRFLSEHHRIPLGEFQQYLYRHVDLAAVGHLFSVACGTDSMLLGEPQVLGQVREAYEAALAARSAGVVLGTLFRQAIVVGKRARTETGISRNAASISYAAVELARKIFGALAERHILIVGAGTMGELTAKTLLDCGAKAVIVANRTRSRAEEIAGRFGWKVLDFAHLAQGLATADIVISSTAAPHYVLRPDLIADAMERRQHRPLFIIDIAVPRDVDPAVQGMADVYLYDVDDLHSVVEGNLRQRESEMPKVQEIVAEETAKFAAWLASLRAMPTITALRSRAELVRQREMEKAAARLRHLSAEDWQVIGALTCAIVNKILHEPTVRLKAKGSQALAGSRYVDVARDLFGLTESD